MTIDVVKPFHWLQATALSIPTWRAQKEPGWPDFRGFCDVWWLGNTCAAKWCSLRTGNRDGQILQKDRTASRGRYCS